MYNKSLFLRIWFVTLGTFGAPVALFTGGISIWLFLAIVVSFIIAWPIYFFLHFSGNSIVNGAFGIGQKPTKREQLVADYQKAKFLLAQERYLEALDIIGMVLEKDTEYCDGLLLKAQILQRMGEPVKARAAARVVLQRCKDDRVNMRWAFSLLKEIDEDDSGSTQ